MTEGHDKNGGLDNETGEHEDCECGQKADIMYLTLEDNTELECDVLGLFQVEDYEYIALVPLEDDQVLLYRYEEDDEGFELITIEEDEEFEMVSEAFDELFIEEDSETDDE